MTEKLAYINYPKTIDISLTGACQLDCPWCWGEKHTVGVKHNAETWKKLLYNFQSVGTSAVVFTGGEPLLANFLPEVLKYAKESLHLRTTLSTNSILLAKLHEKILPWVDDLGISLDGSTPEINKIMRPGKIDNYDIVIDAIKMVQKTYPKIDLTIRTVIAKPNIDDVKNIPQALKDRGVDLSQIRYKLYQVEPIGPRSEIIKTDRWRVDEDDCELVESSLFKKHPELSITMQLFSNTSGRYYQVGPMGNAYGTNISEDGTPSTVELGNPINNFEDAVNLIQTKYQYQSTH